MLLEPEAFVKLCKKYGCSEVEFRETSNSVTNKLDLLEHIKLQFNQDSYYHLNLHFGILEVVTLNHHKAMQSDDSYCEVFSVIRHLAH